MKCLALICLILLAACAQPQYAPQPTYPPAQYPPAQYPPQYVPPTQQAPPAIVPPVAAPPQAVSDEGLGRVQFSLHPYSIGTPEAGSVRPGTPLVAKVIVAKKATGNPPITEEETAGHDGATILVTEIGPKGDIQMYGTSNVESNILPSNRFYFDPTPGIQAWTNDKFVANSNVNTRIKYVILVKYKGDSRELTYTLNVR